MNNKTTRAICARKDQIMSINLPPRQTCQTCGDYEEVRPDGRGFPPDIAKRRLAKRCTSKGHRCSPAYRAGLTLTTREERP